MLVLMSPRLPLVHRKPLCHLVTSWSAHS
uniref:Uncharacterized protein n=1 Tax=Arundo donax TaxID=35708 RepID=A0A0A8Z0Y3_ARUDO